MSDGSTIAVKVPAITVKEGTAAKFSNISFNDQPQPTNELAGLIQQNTDTILHEIFTRLPNLQSGQKIILAIGENHANGLDISLINNLVYEISQQGLNCAYAVEWPDNNIDIHIDEVEPPEQTDITKLKATLALPDYKTLRDKFSADTTPIRAGDARLNRAILHQYMDNHQIPVFCMDAERDWGAYIANERKWQNLLQTDQRTAEAISEAANILKLSPSENGYPPINALHQFGMLARNIYGVSTIKSIIEEHPEIDVVIIGAGRSHTAGNENLKNDPKQSPYEHSLSKLFKAKTGHSVIVANLYISDAEKMKTLPIEAQVDRDILMLEHRLNVLFDTRENTRSDIQESNYIASMSPHFPWISETLNEKTPTKLREQRRLDLLSKLEQFRDKHNFVPQKEEDSSSSSSSDNTGLLENQP